MKRGVLYSTGIKSHFMTPLSIKILKAEQPYLKEQFGVGKLAIFGSFAKGKPTAKSDVDIFIRFDKLIGMEFFDLIDYLEEKLGREVDVLTPGGIQSIRVDMVAKDIKRSLLYVY